MTRFRLTTPVLALLALTTFAACVPAKDDAGDEARGQLPAAARQRRAGRVDASPAMVAPPAEGVAMGITVSDARFARNIVGFQGPESVKYDSAQDVFFVSNMAGAGSAKDDNGYIIRMSAANPNDARVFVRGGANGVTMHAPKGLAIHGDTLWAADIDALRGFDRHTGKPLATIDFSSVGAVQLNDIAVGGDDRVRVTDTGILMMYEGVIHTGPDRVFELGPGGAITTVSPDSASIAFPNGIAWDARGRRWIVVRFDPFVGEIMSLPAAAGTAQKVARFGAARLDGVEVLADGGILSASWGDSSIHLWKDGKDRQVIREVPEPADIGIDTRRHRLAIPLSTLGRVQLWDLRSIGTAADSGSRR